MNLQQLRYVIATAERGTMTAAAASLHVAQPALSRAIRALERELGITIFARQSRGTQLTDDGAALVEIADRVMTEIEKIEQLGKTAALPVCATRSQARELGANAVARHVNGRGGRVHLTVVDTREEVFDAVRTGAARLGIVDLPAPADLVSVTLGWQEFVLVHPRGWALPSPVDVHNLDGVPLLFWPSKDWRRDFLDSVLRDRGIEPSVAVETTERDLITRLVLEGVGAAVMVGRQATAALQAGAEVASFDPPVVRQVGVVSLTGLRGDSATFVDLLRSEASSILRSDDDPVVADSLQVKGTVLERHRAALVPPPPRR